MRNARMVAMQRASGNNDRWPRGRRLPVTEPFSWVISVVMRSYSLNAVLAPPELEHREAEDARFLVAEPLLPLQKVLDPLAAKNRRIGLGQHVAHECPPLSLKPTAEGEG